MNKKRLITWMLLGMFTLSTTMGAVNVSAKETSKSTDHLTGTLCDEATLEQLSETQIESNLNKVLISSKNDMNLARRLKDSIKSERLAKDKKVASNRESDAKVSTLQTK